ncbi:MAG: hypothetical protein M3540_11630 [Actinomycetota bacterium]|nr:hypothetical protein [Actinomycetota bacterium]
MPQNEGWKTHRDLAPWGHDWYPTVWEGTRGRPRDAIKSAIFALAFGGFVYAAAAQWSAEGGLSTGKATVLAIVIAPFVWWIVMFAQIRGWFDSIEFGVNGD